MLAGGCLHTLQNYLWKLVEELLHVLGFEQIYYLPLFGRIWHW